MTTPIFARVYKTPQEMMAAIDGTNLRSYPWGDTVPGITWPEVRYLLSGCMYGTFYMHNRLPADDETFLRIFLAWLPQGRLALQEARRAAGQEDAPYKLPWEVTLKDVLDDLVNELKQKVAGATGKDQQ